MHMCIHTHLYTHAYTYELLREKGVQTTDTFLQVYFAFGFTVTSMIAIQRKNITGHKMQSRLNNSICNSWELTSF